MLHVQRHPIMGTTKALWRSDPTRDYGLSQRGSRRGSGRLRSRSLAMDWVRRLRRAANRGEPWTGGDPGSGANLQQRTSSGQEFRDESRHLSHFAGSACGEFELGQQEAGPPDRVEVLVQWAERAVAGEHVTAVRQ